MNLRIYIISLVAMLCMSYSLFAQRVDYSVVSVQEESGTVFITIEQPKLIRNIRV